MRTIPRDHPDAIWHVTGRVNWRVFHLESDSAFQTLTRVLKRVLSAFGVDLLSDVWMDNHYHMVLRSPPEDDYQRLTSRRTPCRHRRPYPPNHECSQVVTQFARELQCRSARLIQGDLELSGHLWQGRHHRNLISDVGHLVVAIAYDHRNPVRAAMTGSPESFGRSSARWWKYGESPRIPLCTRSEFPLGIPLEEFRALLMAFQEDRAAQDVFAAFARQNIPLSSVRGRKLMDQLLRDAKIDPLACGTGPLVPHKRCSTVPLAPHKKCGTVPLVPHKKCDTVPLAPHKKCGTGAAP